MTFLRRSGRGARIAACSGVVVGAFSGDTQRGGRPNGAGRIVPLPSIMLIKSLGMTETLYNNPFPSSADALNSAGILGWHIPALSGTPHDRCKTDGKNPGERLVLGRNRLDQNCGFRLVFRPVSF